MKLFTRLLWRYLNVEDVEKALRQNRIRKCMEAVTIQPGSAFHEQAMVFNWQKDQSRIQIGKGTHIRAELLIFANGGKITIGDDCYIGEGSRLWSAAEIKIGSNVLVSHNVNIIDTDSHEIDHLERAESYRSLIRSGHPKGKINVKIAPIVIEDYAWISYNVCILKGVTIGKGAIIAAGSVVTKDVPDFVVMAGNPAVQIKKLKEG